MSSFSANVSSDINTVLRFQVSGFRFQQNAGCPTLAAFLSLPPGWESTNHNRPLSFYRLRVNPLRGFHCLPIRHRQSQRVLGNVLHRAEQRHRVEIVEEAEMRDA